MGGMPSAHGVEWKGDNRARARFDANWDRIDWEDEKPTDLVETSRKGKIIVRRRKDDYGC